MIALSESLNSVIRTSFDMLRVWASVQVLDEIRSLIKTLQQLHIEVVFVTEASDLVRRAIHVGTFTRFPFR